MKGTSTASALTAPLHTPLTRPTMAHLAPIRLATLNYLSSRYPGQDLTWHPLFTAVRELWLVTFNNWL